MAPPSQDVIEVQQLRVLATLPQAVQTEVEVGLDHLLPWRGGAGGAQGPARGRSWGREGTWRGQGAEERWDGATAQGGARARGGGARLRLGRGSRRCLLDPTPRARNRPDKLTLGRKLQRGLKGDSVRGHEGPEVLEQLKGAGPRVQGCIGRGLGSIVWGGAGTPQQLAGLRHKGSRRKRERGGGRRVGCFCQHFPWVWGPEAWDGVWGVPVPSPRWGSPECSSP